MRPSGRILPTVAGFKTTSRSGRSLLPFFN